MSSSSHIVTPSQSGSCSSTATGCNETSTSSGSVGKLLTLEKGEKLSELLKQVSNGEVFRLKIPALWPDGCTVAAMRDNSDDDGIGYLPLSVVPGTYEEDAVLIATSGAAVSEPFTQTGKVDLETLNIQPRCGARAFRIAVQPTAAIGTVSLNGNVVWAFDAAESVEKIVVVNVETTEIEFSINITDGQINLSYKGDVI